MKKLIANFEPESGQPGELTKAEYKMFFTFLGGKYPNSVVDTEDCIREILTLTIEKINKEELKQVNNDENFIIRTGILKETLLNICDKYGKDPYKIFNIITGGAFDNFLFTGRQVWLFEQYLNE